MEPDESGRSTFRALVIRSAAGIAARRDLLALCTFAQHDVRFTAQLWWPDPVLFKLTLTTGYTQIAWMIPAAHVSA